MLASFAAHVIVHALLAQDVEGAIDFGVGDGRHGALDLSARHVADLHFRVNLESCIERVAVFRLFGLRLETRLACDLQVFRAADLEELLADAIAQHFRLDLAGILLGHHLKRHLAWTETRHLHVLRQLTDARIHILQHRVLGQGNRDTAFEFAEVFYNVSHEFNPSSM